MDIVVKGRNVEVPDHYRQHVSEKLHKVERYDDKIIRVDVELFHEKNPRQSDHCQRVEITCVSRGPMVRAEACAGDFYSALDAAIASWTLGLRRSADRRRVHRGRHAPMSVAAATSGLTVASEEAVDATIAAERIERRERSDYTERELRCLRRNRGDQRLRRRPVRRQREQRQRPVVTRTTTTSRGTSSGRRNTRPSR